MSNRNHLSPTLCKVTANDGSKKYVFALADGRKFEASYFEVPGRNRPYIACVSTQLGCSVGCLFCATSATQFYRNLSPEEILLQITSVIRDKNLLDRLDLFEISFMGMGEPLANMEALLRVIASTGNAYPQISRVSVSTSGPSHRILAFTEAMPILPPVHLQISLHASNDVTRQFLIPHAPDSITNLLAAGIQFYRKTGDQVCLNYVLIKGLNDSRRDAEWLSSLDKEAFYIKLSALNSVPNMPDAFSPSPNIDVENFSAALRANGAPYKIFTGNGLDISASCGQLATVTRQVHSHNTA